MFDIKQLDNTYTDPQDQLLIALGVHPDQKDAQQKVTDALANGTPKPDAAAAAPAYPPTPTTMAADSGVAPIARPSGAKPILLPEQRLAGDQAELDRLKGTGSGISQIKNPVVRTIARAGDIAGRFMFPAIERDIPGTEGHHQQLIGQAQGNVANDLGVQQKQATLAQEQATTAHTKAETDALTDKPAAPPKPLFDQAGDLIGFQSGENLLGPNSPQLTPDMRDMMAAAKGKTSTKEGEMPLADRVPQLNSMLTTRFQVLNPGKPLPAQYTLPVTATQKDYDRIDKSMEATERATGTKAQQDQVNELRRQNQAAQNQKKSVEEKGIEAAAQTIAKMDPNDLSSLKDISSMRGEQRLLIYNRAKEINPNFNTAEVNRKVKMMDNFTNGKDGQALQSFGTFLEHAGAASTIVDSIRSNQSDTPLLNKPMNWWKQNMSGDPRYTQLVASLEPVKTEAENFMLNGHAMHVEDKKAVDTILSENSSPAQMQSAIKQLGHTVQARFTEMNHRYSGVMKQDIPDAFSDEAKAGASKIGLNLSTNQQQNAGAGRITVTAPDGSVHPFETQAQADAFKRLAHIK